MFQEDWTDYRPLAPIAQGEFRITSEPNRARLVGARARGYIPDETCLLKPAQEFRMGNALEATRRLYAGFAPTPPDDRWRMPLPLAVFGTLRAGFRNHALMQLGPVAECHRAFLPHFRARQIDLYCHPGASAPFEIYCYEPDTWATVIDPVDRLEGFVAPGSPAASYHRSLAWLYLLPEGFAHAMFAPDMLERDRDLGLDPTTWPTYERLPCWIYSSVQQNELARPLPDSPVIWDGIIYR